MGAALRDGDLLLLVTFQLCKLAVHQLAEQHHQQEQNILQGIIIV